jgi:hypothetical protein
MGLLSAPAPAPRGSSLVCDLEAVLGPAKGLMGVHPYLVLRNYNRHFTGSRVEAAAGNNHTLSRTDHAGIAQKASWRDCRPS